MGRNKALTTVLMATISALAAGPVAGQTLIHDDTLDDNSIESASLHSVKGSADATGSRPGQLLGIGGQGNDCNTNGVLDESDIAAGTSSDCNSNGKPDECDFFIPHPLELAEIIASDTVAGDQFGHSISISGLTAIVGANLDDDACPANTNCNSGSAYVLRQTNGVWQQIAKLTADDAAQGDQFGCSVSIDGQTVLIGARFDSPPAFNSGSAYVFREVDGVWQQIAKLTAPDAAADDWFGQRVSLSQDTAIIGAPLDNDAGTDSGSAYIFREIDGVWQFVAKLTASDAAALDNFGWSVAISGNTAIVGAQQDNAAGPSSGSAYVFRENDGEWQQIAKLVADNGAAGDRFGVSTALHNDTAVVGSLLGGGVDSGSAYVFREIEGVWQLQAELLPPDPSPNDNFGINVAVRPGAVVVGAYHDNDAGSDSGSAYVFDKTEDGWSFFAKLIAADTFTGDIFGYSVALEGNSALIGAVWDNAGGANSGAVYAYDLRTVSLDCNANGTPDECDIASLTSQDCNSNTIPDECDIASDGGMDCNTNGIPDECDITVGSSLDCNTNGVPDECEIVDDFGQSVKLTPLDTAAGDQFGHSVSISGLTAVVGANFDDDACPTNSSCNSGSAYVFRQVNGEWLQIAKLTSDDAAQGDQFGCSVSLDGNTALVGARFHDTPSSDSGSAYVFREVDGVWQQIAKLTAPDAAGDDWFGQRVSLSQDTAIIGAPLNDDAGPDSGSAYIFREIDGVWQFVAKLAAADAAAFDNFGWSVAISGNTAVIGSHQDEDVGFSSGSAYVFRESDGDWQQIAKLVADNGAAGDRFGISTAIHNDTAVVGTFLGGGVNSGSAYVFREIEGVWQQQAELLPPDPNPNDNFGISVAVRSGVVVVGAWQNDQHGSGSGSAYTFIRIGGTWVPLRTLIAVDIAPGDGFGYAAAFDGKRALIGAVWDDGVGGNSGAAYVFNLRAVIQICGIDFDGDGIDDVSDRDIDDDGVMNELDACNFTPLNVPRDLVSPDGALLGDFDFDCDVDIDDHVHLAACVDGSSGEAECSLADLNYDSRIDLADFSLVQQRFTGSNEP